MLLRAVGEDGAAAAPKKKKKAAPEVAVELTAEQTELENRLRAWRKAEASATGKPAFLVLTDAALRGLAAAGPRNLAELTGIHGIGPVKAERYGAELVAICRGD